MAEIVEGVGERMGVGRLTDLEAESGPGVRSANGGARDPGAGRAQNPITTESPGAPSDPTSVSAFLIRGVRPIRLSDFPMCGLLG